MGAQCEVEADAAKVTCHIAISLNCQSPGMLFAGMRALLVLQAAKISSNVCEAADAVHKKGWESCHDGLASWTGTSSSISAYWHVSRDHHDEQSHCVQGSILVSTGSQSLEKHLGAPTV